MVKVNEGDRVDWKGTKGKAEKIEPRTDGGTEVLHLQSELKKG